MPQRYFYLLSIRVKSFFHLVSERNQMSFQSSIQKNFFLNGISGSLFGFCFALIAWMFWCSTATSSGKNQKEGKCISYIKSI